MRFCAARFGADPRAAIPEYEIEAELLHEFRRSGADGPAYPSIVAAGTNTCILHYAAGATPLRAGELCLIDAGCELDGYASDVTRTFPADGRFSAPQRELYDLVEAAQAAAVAATRPGARLRDAHAAAVRVLAQGMLDTGLLDRNAVGDVDAVIESAAYRKFYMHGTGHWLGRDVHDVGDYQSAHEVPVEQPDWLGGTVVKKPSRQLEPGHGGDDRARHLRAARRGRARALLAHRHPHRGRRRRHRGGLRADQPRRAGRCRRDRSARCARADAARRSLQATVPIFFVFAACAFASGFALRLADPIVLPVAAHFAITPAAAAMLNTAYALPYALAQPFLGPIGDRFGKPRCIQVCVAGLALMLLLGAFVPSFALLMATRIGAGIFAGGLIPLVLAGLGDAYDMSERQVMIGRMLFAIISGQMLGSVVSGFANDAFGWHSALVIGAGVGAVAAAVAWGAMPAGASASASRDAGSFSALYGRVLANPKAPWLIGGVAVEGVLFYGLFPYMGELLLATAHPSGSIARVTGLVLGAFGIGGLLYAASVRAMLRVFGMRRMCLIGSSAAAACYAVLAIAPTWWLAALAMFIAGISFYMLHNSMQTEATELAPSARGSAVALFACGFFIGQGVGPLVFGAFLHGLGARPALFAIALAMVVLGRVVVAQVVDRRPRA